MLGTTKDFEKNTLIFNVFYFRCGRAVYTQYSLSGVYLSLVQSMTSRKKLPHQVHVSDSTITIYK